MDEFAGQFLSELTFSTPRGQLAAKQFGQGTPCIALHGWLDNAASFDQLAPRLDAQVIALDLRGHGHSDHHHSAYHIWDSISDLLCVAEQIGEPAHWLGHSMGAGIAALFAGCFPEHCRTLSLIEGLGPWVETQLDARAQLRRSARQHQREKGPTRSYQSIELAAQVRSKKGVSPVSAEAIYPVVERALQPVDGGWTWRTDPWLQQPSPLKMLPEQIETCLRAIECPTQVFVADRGMLHDSSMLAQRLEWVSHAELVTLSGDHHLHCYPDAASQIADAINRSY